MMFKFSIFFKTQNTAIHIAAKYKKLNILKILIDYNKAIFKINDSISFYDKYLFLGGIPMDPTDTDSIISLEKQSGKCIFQNSSNILKDVFLFLFMAISFSILAIKN